tara:strand:+ start:8988 stop:10235 length:1248 start_codon:yes stop_codon:yes gene_type:complete
MIVILITFIFLIFCSAFFSGSEIAFLNLKKSNKDIPKNILQITQNSKKLLVGLLSGNTIVNVSIAFIGAFFIHTVFYPMAVEYDWPSPLVYFIEIIVVSFVLLIFGEIIPKVFAIRNSLRFAKTVYFPLKLFFYFLSPLIYILYQFSIFFERILDVKDEKIFDSEEELKILTELGEEQGTLEEEESEMIQSIINFNDKYAGEILTPRVDIIGIEASSSLDDVMDIISKEQFSKIPVYVESIDQIKGIIHAKDVTPYLSGSRPNINLLSIARPPFFAPENKPIDELLKEFKSKKTNMAIIVDEWGGTEGLITLEDVVEEVLGEIRDPFDNEQNLINKITTGTYMVDAKISIYDLEEAIDIEFPSERDYDTLGGFILNQLQSIPKRNDTINYNNITFIVKTVQNNRIGEVKVSKNEK